MNHPTTDPKENTGPRLALDKKLPKTSDSVNDYSSAPPEVRFSENGIGKTLGSTTGEEENAIMAGGWEGTDDATSTAPSDQAVPPAPVVHAIGEELTGEDPNGRAYAGGLNPDDGGIVDLAGRPVEESRDWDKDPIDLSGTGT